MKNDRNINAPLSKIVEAIMKGIDRYKLNLDGFEKLEIEDAIETALASLEFHPSEREVLSGEQFYEKFREVRNELSAVTGTYSLSEAIIKTYDRYIAEKQSKTEEKLYCHHNGKYTLKEDVTCCKCHLPLAEKGGDNVTR